MRIRRSPRALLLAAALAAAACSPSPTPPPATPAAVTPAPTEALVSPPAVVSASPSTLASDSPSPAIPSASASPGASMTRYCSDADLAVAIRSWEGAMGSQIASLRLLNTSATACVIQGTPGLELLDAVGHILIDSRTVGSSGAAHISPGDRVWTVEPLGWVTTMVEVSNYCGSVDPVLPVTIGMVLPPLGTQAVAKANPNGGVPGCSGSPGDQGTIQMNGWAQ